MPNVKGFPKAFSAIKARDIFDYMTAVGASDTDKADFLENAYSKSRHKMAVDTIVEKKDKDGNTIKENKKKMVIVPNSGDITVFNMTKAKKWFKNKYPEAVITKGERVAESEVFAGWGKPKMETDNSTQEQEN